VNALWTFFYIDGNQSVGTTMSTLFLFRHGQASFGQENYDQLSPTGYRQARLVAQHLADMGCRFDAVYTGQLARQKQTFAAMAEVYGQNGDNLPAPVTTPDLDEYDSTGVWQHFYPILTRENPRLILDETRLADVPRAFQKLFAQMVARWIATPEISEIESWQAFQRRIERGLTRIMKREGSGKNVMVFTSAGPIAAAIQKATQMPDDHCIGISWQVMNASLTRFRYNSQKMTLAGFNDVAALERQGDPGLLTYR
jgi:broad specificity phosphatase PhoE